MAFHTLISYSHAAPKWRFLLFRDSSVRSSPFHSGLKHPFWPHSSVVWRVSWRWKQSWRDDPKNHLWHQNSSHQSEATRSFLWVCFFPVTPADYTTWHLTGNESCLQQPPHCQPALSHKHPSQKPAAAAAAEVPSNIWLASQEHFSSAASTQVCWHISWHFTSNDYRSTPTQQLPLKKAALKSLMKSDYQAKFFLMALKLWRWQRNKIQDVKELFIESSNGLNFPECTSLPGQPQPRWGCAQTLCFPALIAPLQAVKAIMKSKLRHFIRVVPPSPKA